MIRKILAVCALALAIGATTTVVNTTPAEAKCKFNCGLAIGLGAGILGSAIVNSGRRDYRSDGYNHSPRYQRRSCRDVRRDCRHSWGYKTRRYYYCVNDYDC